MRSYDNNPMDYYYKNLEKLIISNSSIKSTDLENYINALSLFLSSNNSDYKYNVTFLKRENDKFINFISLSKDKFNYTIDAKNIIEEIFNELNLHTEDVILLTDEFWTMKLSEKTPYLSKDYNMSTAQTPMNSSLLTIYSNNIQKTNITVNLKDVKDKEFKNNIRNIIKKVW